MHTLHVSTIVAILSLAVSGWAPVMQPQSTWVSWTGSLFVATVPLTSLHYTPLGANSSNLPPFNGSVWQVATNGRFTAKDTTTNAALMEVSVLEDFAHSTSVIDVASIAISNVSCTVTATVVTVALGNSSSQLTSQVEFWSNGGIVIRYNISNLPGTHTASVTFLSGCVKSFSPVSGMSYYFPPNNVRHAYGAAAENSEYSPYCWEYMATDGAACGSTLWAGVVPCIGGRSCTFNVTADFSTTNGNPNGRYVYGAIPSFPPIDGRVLLFDSHQVNVWTPRAWASTIFNLASTPFVGISTATVLNCALAVHPGCDAFPRATVIGWRAFEKRSFTLNGTFGVGDAGTVEGRVYLNTAQLFGAVVSSTAQTFSVQGVVRPGSMLWVVVDRNGTCYSDGTPIDAVLTLFPPTQTESTSGSSTNELPTVDRTASTVSSSVALFVPSISSQTESGSIAALTMTTHTNTHRPASSSPSLNLSSRASGSVQVTWSKSLSVSGCDDVMWSVTLAGIPSALASQHSFTVGYDWFSSAIRSAIEVSFVGLWPWRLVGAHVAGEDLLVDMAVVSVTNVTTVRLSPLPTSTSMASGDYVWPGVRRSPYTVSQAVTIVLDIKCRAQLMVGANITLSVKGLPLPAISASSQTVVDCTQQVAAVSGNPASASTAARVSLAVSLASCIQAIEAQSPPDVRSLIPIPFYDSSSPNDDIVNAMIGNYVFILCFAALVVGASVVASWVGGVPLTEVLLFLRWPSILCPAFVSTLPTTVSAILSFIARAADGSLLRSDLAPCGVSCSVAVVVWVSFCVWVAHVCYQGSRMMTSHEKPQNADEENLSGIGCRVALRLVFRSRWEWAPTNECDPRLPDKAPFDAFIRKYQSVFRELRVTWYTAADVWATFVSSVVNAIPLKSAAGCVGVATTNAAISLAFFAIAVVVRPYGSLFGTVHLMLVQLGSLICASCVLGYILAPVDALLSTVAIAAVFVGAVGFCRTAIDVVELGRTSISLHHLIASHRIPPTHRLSTIIDAEASHPLPLPLLASPQESISFLHMEATFDHQQLRLLLLIRRICENRKMCNSR